MKYLAAVAAGFAVGYWLVMKAAPAVQARIEAMNLDEKWDAFHDVFPSDEGDEAW